MYKFALAFAPLLLCVDATNAQPSIAPPIAPIGRILPPVGAPQSAQKLQQLAERAASTERQLQDLPDRHRPDVLVLLKAVNFAIELGEFYNEKDVAKAERLLDEADRRIQILAESGHPTWQRTVGTQVLGYRSTIDNSVQPYGIEIPAGYDFDRPNPLYVWLHGRGDKQTDLHFIDQRLSKPGQIKPDDAIVLHPFGRQCVGFKFAGETDVLQVIQDAQRRYKIDPRRIVLVGFSMGGAGAWHLGAHYTEQWCAVSPGAGFAETARYRRLQIADYPPAFEQRLWTLYDVPNYVRNLFNVPTIAYSGELDKQIQAAQVMEEAFRDEGSSLTHLIGPGVGHKYEPQALAKLLHMLDDAVDQGQEATPRQVHLQTRTLRYPQVHWVKLAELIKHWDDTRVDAEITAERRLRITTRNVAALELDPYPKMDDVEIVIDGDRLTVRSAVNAASGNMASLRRINGHWQEQTSNVTALRKKPFLQGPIDDAFMGPAPFVLVRPTSRCANPELQRWMEFELDHFRARWKALMRGTIVEIDDTQADDASLAGRHVILWGDPESNGYLRRLDDKLPVRYTATEWHFAGRAYARNQFVPVLIYPNPRDPERYVVLNSGLTFREGHDTTNSNQNPKLPDWAILDLRRDPDALSPGKVFDAGFFDEFWQVDGD